MTLVPVPGTTLIRDTKSMALINQDRNGLEDYMKKRSILASQKEEINKLKSDVQDIKSDMQEIKHLVMKLIEKGSNG